MAVIQSGLISLLFLFSCIHFSHATRNLNEAANDQSTLLQYHNGALLSGKISINLIWYGKFKPNQRSIISDFVTSLSSTIPSKSKSKPSVSTWWKTIGKFYYTTRKSTSPTLSLGKQIVDDKYSLGKSLTSKHLIRLASRGQQKNAINVVLTSADVIVEGFCMNRCGTHGSAMAAKKSSKFAYIWVGNSERQCPGQCAWPFHQPIYGPQSTPLIAPNNDVGSDGMVINLASLLAATVTNPFGNGYFQGPKEAPLEVASACPGIYGNGAYPGYPGALLTDKTSGASYNAHGVSGRKFLLPALYDPTAHTCSTLV